MRPHSRYTGKAPRALFVLLLLAACKKAQTSSTDDTTHDAASLNATVESDATAPSVVPSTAPPRTAVDHNAPDAGGALVWVLPNKLGRFIGGPVEAGSDYIRRPYAGMHAQMEVTISDSRSPSLKRSPRGEPSDFFLRESAAYPQMSLDLPKGTGSGFYDCVETPAGQRCSGYIMLFDGFHVEVLNGDATRADIDAMIAVLPLRALATLR